MDEMEFPPGFDITAMPLGMPALLTKIIRHLKMTAIALQSGEMVLHYERNSPSVRVLRAVTQGCDDEMPRELDVCVILYSDDQNGTIRLK